MFLLPFGRPGFRPTGAPSGDAAASADASVNAVLILRGRPRGHFGPTNSGFNFDRPRARECEIDQCCRFGGNTGQQARQRNCDVERLLRKPAADDASEVARCGSDWRLAFLGFGVGATMREQCRPFQSSFEYGQLRCYSREEDLLETFGLYGF